MACRFMIRFFPYNHPKNSHLRRVIHALYCHLRGVGNPRLLKNIRACQIIALRTDVEIYTFGLGEQGQLRTQAPSITTSPQSLKADQSKRNDRPSPSHQKPSNPPTPTLWKHKAEPTRSQTLPLPSLRCILKFRYHVVLHKSPDRHLPHAALE